MGQLLTRAGDTGKLVSLTCMFSAVGLPSRLHLERLLATNPWAQGGRLTGVLMYALGACMLCIEGPSGEADLARDHFRALLGPCEVFEILREPIDRREHAGWSVAFRTASGTLQQDDDYRLVQGRVAVRSLSPSHHLLHAFWNRDSSIAGFGD